MGTISGGGTLAAPPTTQRTTPGGGTERFSGSTEGGGTPAAAPLGGSKGGGGARPCPRPRLAALLTGEELPVGTQGRRGQWGIAAFIIKGERHCTHHIEGSCTVPGKDSNQEAY